MGLSADLVAFRLRYGRTNIQYIRINTKHDAITVAMIIVVCDVDSGVSLVVSFGLGGLVVNLGASVIVSGVPVDVSETLLGTAT